MGKHNAVTVVIFQGLYNMVSLPADTIPFLCHYHQCIRYDKLHCFNSRAHVGRDIVQRLRLAFLEGFNSRAHVGRDMAIQ